MSQTTSQRTEAVASTVRELIDGLYLTTTTRDSICATLERVERDLVALAAHIRRTSFDPGALGTLARKQHDSNLAAARRPENIPLEDPEVIAARWGVVDRGEDGEVPDWFKDRFATHLKGSDEADPSTRPESQ